MNLLVNNRQGKDELLEKVIMHGDLSVLNAQERLQYVARVCNSVGLNPLTKPFDFMKLNGKLVLYARKDAAEQLRKKHRVSLQIVSREKVGDVYVVTARAKDHSGREDESTGAVVIAGLRGDNLANAYMKAETKAKRRVTLSICGLGFLDETEVDSIPGAVKVDAEEKVVELNKRLDSRPPEVIDAEPTPFEREATQATVHPEPELDYEPDMFAKPSIADEVIQFGKKYSGRRFGDIDQNELKEYCGWLTRSAEEQGKPLSQNAADFVRKAEEYING